jgi:hypothetical protein
MHSPEGTNVPYDYYVGVYSWWGGATALVGVLLLLATADRWLRSEPLTTFPVFPQTPRWFWPLVGAAMVLTAAMGSQRLEQDLWDDERKTLQEFVQGAYRPMENGGVFFREFGSGRAFHLYREPNNHILHSILARISVYTWKLFRPENSAPFSEIALRLPAFLFGILSIAALAGMLKELGLARAGVIAAFLLAIHPWHIRYASEARGYALVLCLLPLLATFWLRAMRTGAWQWWGATAAAEFGLIYAYPATLYPVAALNVATLLLLVSAIPETATRNINFTRWLVTSSVAGLALFWLFLPCVPQLIAYLASERAQGSMGDWWLRDFFSHLFAGVSWFKSHDLDSLCPELFAMLTANPRLGQALIWSALVFLAAGTIRLVMRGALSAALTASLLLPAVFAYVIAVKSGGFLYEWYLIYLLPGVIAMMAVGIDATSWSWRMHRWNSFVPSTLLIIFAAGYLAFTTKARAWLLTTPLQPMRASVLLTRETTMPNYPGHEKIVTASFNTPPYLYDPHVVALKCKEELLALMRHCEKTSTPLYLNVGNPLAATFHHPDMFRMMTDSPQFEVVAQLPGFDPTLDRIVARYVPGSRRADQPGR